MHRSVAPTISCLVAAAALVLASCTSARGPVYETARIVAKADSVLLATVGTTLYPYFALDTNSYYEYLNWHGSQRWAELFARSTTRGRFVDGEVRYRFSHPAFPWIRPNLTGVAFDQNLVVKQFPSLSFLPRFLREGHPSDFIGPEDALAIARGLQLQAGLGALEAELQFRGYPAARWVWVVSNVLTETQSVREPAGLMEVIEIDPVTGAILERGVAQYIPSMPSFVK